MSTPVIKNALYGIILHRQKRSQFTKKIMPGEIGTVMAQFFIVQI